MKSQPSSQEYFPISLAVYNRHTNKTQGSQELDQEY